MAMNLDVLSPAKINLFLHVTGKRADGYHELISLMCPVSLYDTLTLSFSGKRLRVFCSHPGVPEDETNLAYRAADLFFRESGIRHPLSITIGKNIPVGAGLGGGSSNAAAVLTALNRHHGEPFTTDRLTEMGLALGADVPFFVYRRPALATGIGEKLAFYGGITPYSVLLIGFDFSVSTARIYKNLNLGLTKCRKIHKSLLFKAQAWDAVDYLCNDLETVTSFWHSEIETAKQALIDEGAAGALMSGSGPTVFGLFSDERQARKAESALNKVKGWTPVRVEMLL